MDIVPAAVEGLRYPPISLFKTVNCLITETVSDIKQRTLGITACEFTCITARLDGDKPVSYIMGECTNHERSIYGTSTDATRYRTETA